MEQSLRQVVSQVGPAKADVILISKSPRKYVILLAIGYYHFVSGLMFCTLQSRAYGSI